MQNRKFGKFKNVINNIYKPIRKGHETIILMLLIATNQIKTNDILFIKLSRVIIRQK